MNTDKRGSKKRVFQQPARARSLALDGGALLVRHCLGRRLKLGDIEDASLSLRRLHFQQQRDVRKRSLEVGDADFVPSRLQTRASFFRSDLVDAVNGQDR